MISYIRIFLVILFSLSSTIQSSSDIADLLDLTRTIIILYPEDNIKRDELIAKESLNWGVTSFSDQNSSIFSTNIHYLAKISGRSERDQYIWLMSGLCQHLERCCLTTMVNFKRSQISALDIIRFSVNLKRAVAEIHYFNRYQAEDYEFPDRTVTLIVKALHLVAPKSEFTGIIIFALAQFCRSKACVVPLFEMAKDFISETLSTDFLGLTLSHRLQAHNEYDEFLGNLVTEPLVQHTTSVSVLKTIISGPVTELSNKILLDCIRDEVIQIISRHDWQEDRLALYIIKAYIFDQAIERLSSTNSHVVTFKSILELYKENHDTITKLIGYDYDLLQPEELSEIEMDALKDFYKLDKELVTECVLKLDRGITVFVERALESESDHVSLSFIQGAITLLGLFPYKRVVLLNRANYEIILDFLLKPSIFPHIKDIVKSTYGFRNILRLNHVDITRSTLEKYFTLYLYHSDENGRGNSINNIFFLILAGRELDPDSYSKTFELLRQFAVEMNFSFSVVASFTLQRVIIEFQGSLGGKVLESCKAHNLVTKTEMKLAELILIELK